MKAMILAAGKGTRVRPITNSIPKPMIPIVRKPVMQSIIELLRAHGVQEIVVNTSHLANSIESYFRDGEQLGVNISYSYEGYLKGNEMHGNAVGSAGSMKNIQDFSGFFDETFVVLCGDAWIDLDIGKAYEFHKSRQSLATVILQQVPNKEVYKYGVVELNGKGQIQRFQEKPDPKDAVSNLINTGIYIFEPEIFNYIPSGVEYDIGGDLFPDLACKKVPFYGYPMDFQWVDIGSIPDVLEATKLALNGDIQGYQIPGKQVRKNLWLGSNISLDLNSVEIRGPVYIGNGTHIKNGATIVGPSLIGANCVIEEDAVITESIIDDYTRISSLATIDNKLVFGNRCIDPSGRFLDIEEADISWLMDDSRRFGDEQFYSGQSLFKDMINYECH